MGMNIANCPRCGKIFAMGLREVCRDCVKEIDEMYERCVKYLRAHKGCTIGELSEETEVSIKQITRFIREGRISIYDNPEMGYPCDVCGIMIRDGSMCDSCRNRLAKDVNVAKDEDRRRREELQNQLKALTYKNKDE